MSPDHSLSRIDETLHAFNALAAQPLRTQPRSGVLRGMTIVVKDNIDVAGLATTAGSALLLDNVPQTDAPAVARLCAAGADIVGKANMHELALGVTSANPTFGFVRNPIDPTRFAGGSSGGTAAAIACGAVDAGLGTDTGGSVRIPAALTGLVGFRPTVGRYPSDGVIPLSPTRDTIGPMARTIADLVVLDSVLAEDSTPAEASREDVRLGVPKSYFLDALHPQTAQAFDDALRLLTRAGIRLIDIPETSFDDVEAEVGLPITLYEAANTLLPLLFERTHLSPADLVAGIRSDDVRALFREAIVAGAPARISQHDYREALHRRDRFVQARYRNVFDRAGVDALIFPTTPRPAGLIDGELSRIDRGDGTVADTFATFVRNTCPGSIAGVPGLTVPIAGEPNSLPIGLSLDAPWNSDRRLLGLGLRVEAALQS